MAEIEITRGDTTRLLITVVRPDDEGVDQPVDLTDCTLWFTAKRAYADADVDAVIAKKSPSEGIVISDAAGGLALASIEPADTAAETGRSSLLYDAQLLEPGGIVTTLDEGCLLIKRDVTRDVSP